MVYHFINLITYSRNNDQICDFSDPSDLHNDFGTTMIYLIGLYVSQFRQDFS